MSAPTHQGHARRKALRAKYGNADEPGDELHGEVLKSPITRQAFVRTLPFSQLSEQIVVFLLMSAPAATTVAPGWVLLEVIDCAATDIASTLCPMRVLGHAVPRILDMAALTEQR